MCCILSDELLENNQNLMGQYYIVRDGTPFF